MVYLSVVLADGSFVLPLFSRTLDFLFLPSIFLIDGGPVFINE